MRDAIAEIEQVIHDFAACWNRHDMAAFADLFSPDAEFVNVVGMWWRGREEIRKAHELTHATMFKDSRLTIAGIAVRCPRNDLALARARWTLEGHVSPAGDALPARAGILFNVLVQDASGWSIIDSQNTDIVDGVLSRPQ